MNNSPEIMRKRNCSGSVDKSDGRGSLLSAKHSHRLQGKLDPSRTFIVNSCATLASGLAALRKRQFEVVVCERNLPPGS